MAATIFVLPKSIAWQASVVQSGAKANFFISGTSTRQNTFSDFALSVAHANPVVADGNGLFAPIYLDDTLNYKLDLTDSDDISLTGYPVDNIASLTTKTAVSVTVADAGAFFADSDVEAVLQDIGANYPKNATAETISGARTHSNSINMQDNNLIRPVLLDYAINLITVNSSSGTATYDVTDGNAFQITLDENVTTTVLSNPSTADVTEIIILITQGVSAFTVVWPSSVKWPAGVAPVISTGSGALDLITLVTYDAGTTWLANFSQAFA